MLFILICVFFMILELNFALIAVIILFCFILKSLVLNWLMIINIPDLSIWFFWCLFSLFLLIYLIRLHLNLYRLLNFPRFWARRGAPLFLHHFINQIFFLYFFWFVLCYFLFHSVLTWIFFSLGVSLIFCFRHRMCLNFISILLALFGRHRLFLNLTNGRLTYSNITLSFFHLSQILLIHSFHLHFDLTFLR